MDTFSVTDTNLEALYTVSIAAKLAGMHPQTLRQYDRLGLVIPKRTKGRGRRYSTADIAALREVQRLSKEEGVNLAGIKQILILKRELLQVEAENQRLKATFMKLQQARVFTAGPEGNIATASPYMAKRQGTDIVRYRDRGQIVPWPHSR